MTMRLLAGVVLSVVAVFPAFAADFEPGMPVYKAPPVFQPPVFDWTGFYVGAHVLATWSEGHGQTTNTATGQLFEPGSSSSSALHGGGQIGFDYMVAPHIVLGVVTDINSGVDRTTSNVTPHETSQNESDGIVSGTFRGRAGYAFDNTLLYATAGGTWNDAQSTRTQIAGTVGNAGPGTVETASTSHIGWTVGGGVDYAFNRNWDVFAEYRYSGSPDLTVTFPVAQRSSVSSSDTNAVEVGVNYRFGYGR
jgi:opacity protein-like surface antigen